MTDPSDAPEGEPADGHAPAPWAPPVEWEQPPTPDATTPPPPPPPPAPAGAPGDRPHWLPPWPQHPPHDAPPGWVDPRAPWSEPRPPFLDGAPWGTMPAPVGDNGFPIYGPGSIPSIGRRALARLVDTGLVFVVFVAASLPFMPALRDPNLSADAVPLWYFAASQVLAVVYETITVGFWGTSVGKLVVGLRVEGPDGRRPGLARAAPRILLPALLGSVPVFGGYFIEAVLYLTALPNPLHQGLHDRVAGTIVVSTR